MKKPLSRGKATLLYSLVAGAAFFVLAFVDIPPNVTVWVSVFALFFGAMILYASSGGKKEK